MQPTDSGRNALSSFRDFDALLQVLAQLDPHPESVPLNMLVPVAGTPLADQPPVDTLEMVRMVATTRLVMPRATVRLSAGRSRLSRETQVLCFVAGVNSIFVGEVLLTTPNTQLGHDAEMLAVLAGRSSDGRSYQAPETSRPV